MGSTSATISSRVETPLSDAFARCHDEGRAALVVYTTAGHPSREVSLDVLLALSDAGADVIELGVPFSDPLADGPTIQRSSYEAIAGGADLPWCLELLARFRAERDTPIVLFSYLNPLLNHGMERFLEDAAGAGAQGVLITDLPAGADTELEALFAASPLDLVRLVAPTTRPERVGEIASLARGFLYYISRTGVTGAGATLADALEEEIAAVRAASPVPVAVGFGISSAEQAARVARAADGVVVGSALVQALATGGVDAAYRLVSELRGAVERNDGGHAE